MDLEEEKKQSDGEMLEKGKTMRVIYNGDRPWVKLIKQYIALK